MDLLVNTSLIAAFLAGVAALFAPCCITVLLPTYFASIFRQRRTVFLMTFVYFLGLLIVFLPIGFAAGSIARVFSDSHTLIFATAGTFLTLLGASLILGWHPSLPFKIYPRLKGKGMGSIFILGVLSGLATTCCAPVLAGVIAMATLPGSTWLAGVYTLTYVMGMVAPLFIMAVLLDKTKVIERIYSLRKPITYGVGKFKVTSTVANTLVGIAYLLVGLFVLYHARNNDLSSYSSFAVSLNVTMTKLLRSLDWLTGAFPQWVWALIVVGIFLLITRAAIKQLRAPSEGERHEHIH